MNTILGIGLCLGIVIPSVGGENNSKEIEKIEKLTIQQRKAIKTGKLTIISETFLMGSKTPNYVITRNLWFDSKSSRCDFIKASATEKTFRILECYECEKKGYHVVYTDQEQPNGIVPVFLSKNVEPRTKNVKLKKIIDIRLLGMVPNNVGQLHHMDFESYLLRPDRQDLLLEKTKFKDAPCWLVKSRLKKSTVRMWIVPDLGNNIVRVEVEFSLNNQNVKRSAESEIKKFGETWFPVSCIYEEVRDGQLQKKEVSKVTKASFNEAIPEKAFKLIGMDIPPGTAVRGFKGDEDAIWDGTKIRKQNPPVPISQFSPGPGTERNWFVGLAILFSVIAALATFVYCFKKKPNG